MAARSPASCHAILPGIPWEHDGNEGFLCLPGNRRRAICMLRSFTRMRMGCAAPEQPDRFQAESSCGLNLLSGLGCIEGDHGERLAAMGSARALMAVEGDPAPDAVPCLGSGLPGGADMLQRPPEAPNEGVVDAAPFSPPGATACCGPVLTGNIARVRMLPSASTMNLQARPSW